MKIGQILIDHNLLQPIELKEALSIQEKSGSKLGSILIELGYISGLALAQLLSKQLKIPTVMQDQFINVSKDILNLVPHYLLQEHRMFPFAMENKKLHVAFSDPPSDRVFPVIEKELDLQIKVHIAPELWISSALERYYAIPREIHGISLEDFGEDLNTGDLNAGSSLNPFPTSARDNEETGKNEFLKDNMSCTSPAQIFQNLFQFLHVGSSGIMVFRKLENQCRPFLISGFPLPQKEFQSIEPHHITGLFKLVQHFKKPKQHIKKNLNDLLSEEFFEKKLSLSASTESYIYPIYFRNSLQFCIVVLPLDHKPDAQKLTSLYPQAIAKAAIALELLFLKQEVEKPFE